MKAKLMTASLLFAALPLAAQADPATERTLQLNEPLAAVSQHAPATQAQADASSDIVAEGGSDAMAKARLKLRAQQQHETDIADSGDSLAPAREATT
ncbi:hypothetical protein FZZ93_12615 [Halomonas eurihalina]|uniref:DUF4148 domain-containing protein n=1 Tax=Halomonas eurihalina TaxID=42566 RepID=A0A5D9CW79_HALER|nr:hypothetical protein [Halomonas eurihalina]MDR5861053.1 hypothetical protein [Halomonas eurihalina]TZG35626.1 hypothetical protein FZZ93_12615 [Halomonas eurihalina]